MPPGTANRTPPPRRGRAAGCLATCLASVVIALCGLVAVGGGGYYLYATGQFSARQALNFVGLGTGEISVANAADPSVRARLTRLDTEDGQPDHFNSVDIEPFDMAGFGAIPPGHYELTLEVNGEAPGPAACLLRIASGDFYQFVLVPEGIAVSRKGQPASTADELDVQTSSLCKA